MRGARALGALLALSACGPGDEIPPEDFPHEAAVVACDRTAECMRGTFESAFFGRDDCVATLERSYERLVETMDDRGCDYGSSAAGAALAEVADMSCERFYEGDDEEVVADVWDDCARP